MPRLNSLATETLATPGRARPHQAPPSAIGHVNGSSGVLVEKPLLNQASLIQLSRLGWPGRTVKARSGSRVVDLRLTVSTRRSLHEKPAGFAETSP
jgi:hypothetical protein